MCAAAAGKEGRLAAGSFDSLAAVELTNGLNTALNLKLPGTLVFDYPSVQAIAEHIHGLLAGHGSAAEAVPEALPAPAALYKLCPKRQGAPLPVLLASTLPLQDGLWPDPEQL